MHKIIAGKLFASKYVDAGEFSCLRQVNIDEP